MGAGVLDLQAEIVNGLLPEVCKVYRLSVFLSEIARAFR